MRKAPSRNNASGVTEDPRRDSCETWAHEILRSLPEFCDQGMVSYSQGTPCRPFRGPYCLKGELPMANSQPSIEEIRFALREVHRLMFYRDVLFVLECGGQSLRYGIAHPDTFVCSKAELDIAFVAWMRKWRDGDAQHTLYVRLMKKVQQNQLLFEKPNSALGASFRNVLMDQYRREEAYRRMCCRWSRSVSADAPNMRDVLEGMETFRRLVNGIDVSFEEMRRWRSTIVLLDPHGIGEGMARRLKAILPDYLFRFVLVWQSMHFDNIRTAEAMRRTVRTIGTYVTRVRKILSQDTDQAA